VVLGNLDVEDYLELAPIPAAAMGGCQQGIRVEAFFEIGSGVAVG